MFAVVKYFNYKEMYFDILKIYKSFKSANNYAKELAYEEYGENVVQGVENECLYTDAGVAYTQGDGYDQWVFAVLELPDCVE